MSPRSLVLTLVVAGCTGVSSNPGPDAGTEIDGAAADATSRQVMEQEPNNERVQATKLPSGGGDFVITGTCADSIDNDYYDANPGVAGPYAVRLEWQAGNYTLMFDPEDGFSGSQTESATPPLMASGQVLAGIVQFNIDCYNTGNPSGLTGLAYTAYLTLPQ